RLAASASAPWRQLAPETAQRQMRRREQNSWQVGPRYGPNCAYPDFLRLPLAATPASRLDVAGANAKPGSPPPRPPLIQATLPSLNRGDRSGKTMSNCVRSQGLVWAACPCPITTVPQARAGGPELALAGKVQKFPEPTYC